MSNEIAGFVGFGAMAKRMAHHVRDAGYDVIAYAPSSTPGTIIDGSRMMDSPRSLAADSSIVLISVPNDDALTGCVYGESGVLAGMREGGLIINTSSVSPEASRRLARAGAERGIGVLDAPVSGSTPEAEKGELVVLVGGDAADLERARPLLEAIGKKTIHAGPAGQGSVLKLAINGIMVSTMAVIAEAMAYGVSAGLDRERLLETLGSLAVVSPHHQRKLKAIGEDRLDPQFPTWLARKDLGLLLADAARHKTSVTTNAAATQAMSLTAQSHDHADYSAVVPMMIALAGS